jgi:hypothetical protein
MVEEYGKTLEINGTKSYKPEGTHNGQVQEFSAPLVVGIKNLIASAGVAKRFGSGVWADVGSANNPNAGIYYVGKPTTPTTTKLVGVIEWNKYIANSSAVYQDELREWNKGNVVLDGRVIYKTSTDTAVNQTAKNILLGWNAYAKQADGSIQFAASSPGGTYELVGQVIEVEPTGGFVVIKLKTF